MNVRLYRAPTTEADADEIADWLEGRGPVDSVGVRDRFLDAVKNEVDTRKVAEGFASARVMSPYDESTGSRMEGVVRYELRALDDPGAAGGVLYDGFQVQRLLYPYSAGSGDCLDVVLLDRALATWGEHDGRWHKRVVVLGQPALVSVPGLYEAPAKPEEYYKAKQKHALATGDAPPREVLESRVEGDFLVERDPRTTEALKGYVLQAVDYHVTGEAFCDEPGCRLYNAHRQGELVEAQLREPEFCDEHARLYG
ncbi:MAG: DUF7001 family protein [Halobacteriales archaeon]